MLYLNFFLLTKAEKEQDCSQQLNCIISRPVLQGDQKKKEILKLVYVQITLFFMSTFYVNGLKYILNRNLTTPCLFIINCYGVFMCLLDELLLPHMRKIDGMLNDNRKRLLSKLRLDHTFKVFSFKL